MRYFDFSLIAFIFFLFVLFFASCTKQNVEVQTKTIIKLISTNAIIESSVYTNKKGVILKKGVCWNISGNPLISDLFSDDGSAEGAFKSNLNDLIPNTVYYIKAYAETDKGIVYGNEINLLTPILSSIGGVVTDIDGNNYETLIFGNGQVWMKSNLKTERYSDGSIIPNIITNDEWTSDNLDYGGWCYYNNNITNNLIYGKLYNGYAVVDNRGLCPTGWRIPSDEDWHKLELFLGVDEKELDLFGYRGDDYNVGGKMKNLENWHFSNEGATNETNFSGQPGGQRSYYNGEFSGLNVNGMWWSSSELNSDFLIVRNLFTYRKGILRISEVNQIGNKKRGSSIRCLKE
jgi:uncharacterized protein (TIGR02145 family)